MLQWLNHRTYCKHLTLFTEVWAKQLSTDEQAAAGPLFEGIARVFKAV